MTHDEGIALVWRKQARKHGNGRALPCAVPSDNRHQFAGVKVKVDARNRVARRAWVAEPDALELLNLETGKPALTLPWSGMNALGLGGSVACTRDSLLRVVSTEGRTLATTPTDREAGLAPRFPIQSAAGGPGFATDLPATFMYAMAFSRGQIGQGAAAATVMLATIAAIVVPYLYSELRVKK